MVDITGATLKSLKSYLQERAASTTGVSKSLGLNNDGSGVVAFMPRFLNVLEFGAAADYDDGDPTASTDNTGAFQRAMTAAIATGGVVFVPAGAYYFAQGSAALDPGIGGFSMTGEYGQSVLYFHEGTTGTPMRTSSQAGLEAPTIPPIIRTRARH